MRAHRTTQERIKTPSCETAKKTGDPPPSSALPATSAFQNNQRLRATTDHSSLPFPADQLTFCASLWQFSNQEQKSESRLWASMPWCHGFKDLEIAFHRRPTHRMGKPWVTHSVGNTFPTRFSSGHREQSCSIPTKHVAPTRSMPPADDSNSQLNRSICHRF